MPFAGNFVIEQLAALANPACEIFSSDISVYSMAIGHGLSGELSDIEVTDEIKSEFPKIFNKELTPLEKAAAAIFLSDAAIARAKASQVKYYEHLYRNAKNNQEQYFAQIMRKLEKAKALFGQNFHFHAICGLSLLDKAGKGDFIFFDPPFVSDSYDKQFKALSACFTYREPIFTYITEEIKQAKLHNLNQLGAVVYYRPENPLPDGFLDPEFKEVFRYRHTYDAHYCIYSNYKSPPFVGSFQPLREKPENIQIISTENIITKRSTIAVGAVSSQIANHYRLMWIKKARMKDNGRSYIITVDKKLIGIVQLGTGQTFGNNWVLINSDPIAPTSRYKRLSKLMLSLICTEEFINLFNSEVMWQHSGYTTKVYTNAPMSMKYRGLFDIFERKETPKAQNKYEITYRSKKLKKTMRQALTDWVDKYGEQLVENDILIDDD